MRTHLAVVCSLVAATALAAGRFEGTFKSDTMTVTLNQAGGQYKGVINFNGKEFPCQAQEAGQGLQGTFSTPGGHAFPFQATLAGDTFSLRSGSTTYTLTRQAANPLDVGPTVPPVLPPPPPPPPETPGRRITIDISQMKADFRRAAEAYNAKDYATALRIGQPVAAQGHVGACHMVGLMYEHGRGTAANPAEAAKWYARAGDHGPSLLNLGMFYRDGNGVPKDVGKAKDLFERSARLGEASGQRALGAVYINGLGVPRNPVEGVAWMLLAEKGGDQVARDNVAMIRDRNYLSALQWQQATQRAAALQQQVAQGGDVETPPGPAVPPPPPVPPVERPPVTPATGGDADIAFSSPGATLGRLAAGCALNSLALIQPCISANAPAEFAELRDGKAPAARAQEFMNMFKGVGLIRVEQVSPTRAKVHVRLPNHPRGQETLNMAKEAGGWKIVDF